MSSSRMARAAFAVAGIAAVVLLGSIVRPSVGTLMPLVVVAALAVSSVAPTAGVLILVGLGPVTPMLSVIAHADQTGIHFTEALVLAFIAGASLRRVTSTTSLAVAAHVLWPALLLIVAALTSAIVQEPALAAEQQPLVGALPYARTFLHDYLVLHNNMTLALQMAEGLLLVILAADAFARRPQARGAALRMLVGGASGAAALNVLRLLIAASRQPDAIHALREYALNSRINAQYSDWNAAGSYFAMVLVVAGAFVLRRRVAYAAPAVLLAAAVWLTGSRTAIAAVLLVAVVAAVFMLRRSSVRRASVLVAVLALIAATAAIGWRYYPSERNDPSRFSWTTRVVLWKAGVRMMATNPAFGVGVGRFYDLSPAYAAPVLAVIWRPHENAHNNFVQILAELGIPGLLFFVGVVGGAWLMSARAARRDGDWTVPAAIGTFLLTCLTGHPILVLEAAFPFWLVVGIAAAQNGASVRPRRRWTTIVGGCVVLVFVLSVPARTMTAIKNADRERTSVGLSPWQEQGGNRFRWAGSRSSFYYSSAGHAIRIPLRLGPDAPPEVLVRIYFDGHEADRVRVNRDEDWHIVRFVRPHQGSDSAFFRIDLDVVDIATLQRLPEAPRMLMIGQPSIVWQQ